MKRRTLQVRIFRGEKKYVAECLDLADDMAILATSLSMRVERSAPGIPSVGEFL